MKKTVKELAAHISGTVCGDPATVIEGVTSIDNPKKNCITFIENAQHLSRLEQTDIGCIIAPQRVACERKTLITVKDPKLSFAQIMQLFYPPRSGRGTIAKHVTIDSSARIAPEVTIEDFVVIGKNVTIGKNSIIQSFTYIDEDVSIGANVVIHPHVTIYDHTQIGSNVRIHSSSVIGSDGFGYVKDETGTQVKIPQVGNVIIEDGVEIGSNVSIDRATLGSTILKKGVKVDNLVQIAHNVYVGEHTVICGSAGIAGSARIGKNCTIAAAVGVGDHCIVEDNVIIAGKAGVPSKKRIHANQVVAGQPARPLDIFIKQQGLLAKLPQIIAEVKEVRKGRRSSKSE